jgi:hypothetical protein
MDSSSLSARQSSKNPIALRIYKVLGTNYKDDALRESLQSLKHFYPDVATEQIAGDFPTGDSNPDLLGSKVAFVSKNLSRDLQTRLETSSLKYLKAFELVNKVRFGLLINVLYIQCLIRTLTISKNASPTCTLSVKLSSLSSRIRRNLARRCCPEQMDLELIGR